MNNQLQIILRYKVRAGESQRFNCPFCNGNNTLSITNANGSLQWHCFRASCDANGKHEKGLTLNESMEQIRGLVREPTFEPKNSIPDFLVDIRHSTWQSDWLISVNSLLAYNNRLVHIKYDPVSNRIMFPIENSRGYTVGYTGRHLTNKPKWKKYGDCRNVFTCGTGPIAVLTEDAPSACAVGVLPDYTGVSILGTYLTDQHKADLLNYPKIYVCLDPDAGGRGLSISRQLPNSTFKQIPDDLKYFSPDQIKEILK